MNTLPIPAPRPPPLLLQLVALVVLLPTLGPLAYILMLNPAVATRVVSIVIPRAMRQLDKEMKRLKAVLATYLPAGRVLDVGAGGGSWLAYLDHVNEVVALEPNPRMKEQIVAVASQVLVKAKCTPVTGFVSDLPPNAPFDGVVLGNVLCEVPDDQVKFLHEINRLLKPGGRVIFLEHVRSKNAWVAAFQDVYNPCVLFFLLVHVPRARMG